MENDIAKTLAIIAIACVVILWIEGLLYGLKYIYMIKIKIVYI